MIDIEQLTKLIKEIMAKEKPQQTIKIEEEICTENQACKLLNTTRPTMLKLRKNGKVKYFKVGKGIRYKKSDLFKIGE